LCSISPGSAPAIASERALARFEREVQLTAGLNHPSTIAIYDYGRTAEGVKLLRRALTLRANYPDPHYQLGRIALDRKDYTAALAELELARRLLAAGPVSAQGVAQARALLADATSPIYHRASPDDLRTRVLAAADALSPV